MCASRLQEPVNLRCITSLTYSIQAMEAAHIERNVERILERIELGDIAHQELKRQVGGARARFLDSDR